MMGLAVLCARLCTKDGYIRNIYTYGLAFANFGFMGNAVVSAVFPEVFLEYLIFTLSLWIKIYLWGVPCLLMPAGEGKRGLKSRLKPFFNPMLICVIIGMVIGITGLKLPLVTNVIDIAGSCMSPVAMPLGLNTIVIPAAFGKDTSVAAGMAIVSHLISCITIPLIFALMMKLL